MLRHRRSLFLFAVSCLLAMSSWVHAEGYEAFKGLEGTLRIAGGTAHIPVMQALAQEVMTRYPSIRITVAGGGSGVGIKQVGEGLVDIGNSGRQPTDEEVAKYGLKVFRWAMDGVAVVVHPQNPVQSLTSKEVQDIFSGTLTNWKQVGGPDKAIHVITRDEASGTREVFWEKALRRGPIRQDADVVPSNGAMKTAVATDPASIGYMSVGYVDETVRAVTLDGVQPTTDNVVSGLYPVARGLYSLTKGEPSPLAKAFLELLHTAEGQSVISAKGYIPIHSSYGIFPMLTASLLLAFTSLAVAFPVSLGCAGLIFGLAPPMVGKPLRRLVQLMTGFPTVVYGFVGVFVLVPAVRNLFDVGSGRCLLSALVPLSLMITPTMTLFFSDAFAAVPQQTPLASAACGAHRVQSFCWVVIPCTKKGLAAGTVLSFGRALGDTLISLMLAGNAAQVPSSLLASARTLTAHIALVIASLEFASIFLCGVVLYVFTKGAALCAWKIRLGMERDASS